MARRSTTRTEDGGTRPIASEPATAPVRPPHEVPEGPVRRTSLVDEIASRLQKDVFQRRYAPGEALPPERVLAAKYGVTRTSLKHALVRLEELGLIRTRHGVGSIVQDVQESGGAEVLKYLVSSGGVVDDQLLRDVIEARGLGTVGVARLAARRRTKEDLAALDQLLGELNENKGDTHELERLEARLFRALARAGHNHVFQFIINSIGNAYRADWQTHVVPFREGTWMIEKLGAIVDAVRERDEEKARIVAEDYFSEVARRVLPRLKEKD
jgi:GntR family transcriptional regulator, transcriptional repressor for pyruvate dehydrogenase complex